MPRRVVVEYDAQVPMPDGVTLATDVYRPESSGPVPAVLLRTPYSRDLAVGTISEHDPFRHAHMGVATVIQDIRGRHGSGGAFAPLVDDPRDGATTLAWLAAQPWCSGRIGMAGGSYNGMTQLACATRNPPELAAIAPLFAASLSQVYLPGGATGLAALAGWIVGYAQTTLERERAEGRPWEASAFEQMSALAAADPLEQLRVYLQPDSILRQLAAPLWGYIEHDTIDDYWRKIDFRGRLGEVDVAGLHIGGWFDALLGGTLDVYRELREGPAGARQHLVLGPWAHGGLHGLFPEIDFGPRASAGSIDLMGRQARFFAGVLGSQPELLEGIAPVETFVTGIDEWRTAGAWPPPTSPLVLHLRSDGQAHTPARDGRLSAESPTATEPLDEFTYDPADPVPTVGGRTLLRDMAIYGNAGPKEQSRVEAREDVLLYTSDVLVESLEVAGEIVLVLHVATSARDTEFTARLTDVDSDGRSFGFADGIARLSWREGGERPLPVVPNEPYELHIDLGSLHHVFAAGHRIRLQVSSSNYPHCLPHPNVPHHLRDGWIPAGVIARQRVLHDAEHPSALRLPVVS